MGFISRHKVAAAVCGVLLLCAFLAGLGFSLLNNKLESKVATINLPSGVLSSGGSEPLPQSYVDALTTGSDGKPMNILLLGSDTRQGQDPKFGSDGDIGGARSDTAMLVHVAADRHSVSVLSIPRDLWVNIPACTGPAGDAVASSEAKFNDAFQRGGVSCTIKTVTAVTGIPVNHVAVVDFAGFEKIVNTLGGIPVCLRTPIDDERAQLKLPAGQQTVSGAQALGLMRARYSLGDGSDLSRIGRQQKMVRAVIDYAKTQNLVTDPKKLYDLLSATLGNLSTDQEMSTLPAMANIAWQLKDVSQADVAFKTVPVKDRGDGANVVVDNPAASDLFRKFVNDSPMVEATPTPSATGKTPTPSPPKAGTVCDNPIN